MPRQQALITGIAFVLPIVVAAADLSLLTTLLVVVGLLAWSWLATLAGLGKKPGDAAFVLDTITASHFAEKVRWCLDRLGVPYRERRWAGTLNAFYRGRTVPVLEFRTGRMTSRIGNSAEILRYLWGAFANERPDAAAFLEPTPERTALEKRLDRYGRMLQVWVYSHLLDDREQTLRAWGVHDTRVPAWQRRLLSWLYPVQARLIRRVFRIGPGSYERAKGDIEEVLGDIERQLGDHDSLNSILGDGVPNYTDYAFAALSSVWALPRNLARDDGPLLDIDALPEAMRNDIEGFRERFPAASAFVDRLYRDYRDCDPGDDDGQGET